MDIWRLILLALIAFCLVGAGVLLFFRLPYSIQRIFYSPIRFRDTHKNPVPRIGGVLIIPIIIFLIGGLVLLGVLPMGISWQGIIFGAMIVLGYGVWDERKDLSWKVQLIIQICIGLILVISGITITGIMIPFGGIWALDTIMWRIGSLSIYPLSALVSVFWVVGLMNVVNWLDGLDGLASSIGVIAFITLTLLALTPFVGQYHIAVLGMILAGSYAGVLWFNWHPAKIFLGTTGSMFLGYMLAVLSLMSGGKVGTSALVFAFPILDACIVILRRLSARCSIFEADRRHLHYGLLDIGWSQKRVVWFLLSISALFGVCALLLGTVGKFIIFLAGGGVLLCMTMWIREYEKRFFESSLMCDTIKCNDNDKKQYETRV